jgi:predicted metal-dependent phosphoesterase TrpH
MMIGIDRDWTTCVLGAVVAVWCGAALPAPPADDALRWWKGNLHTHTFWSDGDEFPEVVADWYREHGYHFLAQSDHNVLARGIRWLPEAELVKRGGADVVDRYVARFGAAWVERRGAGDAAEVRLKPLEEFRALVEERGRFLLIPAEEISDRVAGLPLHINATNIAEPLQPLGGSTMVEAINANLRAVHEQAEKAGREILTHLNHPNYHYAVTPHDLAHAVLERHFEVFNGHPHVNQRGDATRPGLDRFWDIANTIRLVDLAAPPLFGLATDDAHDYHGPPEDSRPGRGWVMVQAAYLTPEHIVRAIQRGDFYASTGVELREVSFDADRESLRVAVQPARDATYVIQFFGSLAGVDTRGQLPEADPDPARRGRHRYSEAIGAVLATVAGTEAEYALTGRELYVRAVVTSSLPPADPVWDGQRQQAWTQPVGWTVPAAAP